MDPKQFVIPEFFASGDDDYILNLIMKHYLDGTLPMVMTAYREHIDEWSERYEHNETRLRQSRGEKAHAATFTN